MSHFGISYTLFLKSWDVQHDIFSHCHYRFNSYLSYWSLCYICKFNAVCFLYYLRHGNINDPQATYKTSTSRKSTCSSELGLFLLLAFIRSKTLLSFNFELVRTKFVCIYIYMYDMLSVTLSVTSICHSMQFPFYTELPKNRNSRFSGLCSDQQLSFFTLLDRASFPHYNNTMIIKFGWELFILWVISYGL